jgi:hypothetical protein
MQARDEGGLLYWFSSVPISASEKPVTNTAAQERTMRITYVITNRGHARWVVHPKELNGPGLLDFLERLARPGSQKLFLLVEDLPLFGEPAFIEWSVANKHRFGFHFLPAITTATFDPPGDRRA